MRISRFPIGKSKRKSEFVRTYTSYSERELCSELDSAIVGRIPEKIQRSRLPEQGRGQVPDKAALIDVVEEIVSIDIEI